MFYHFPPRQKPDSFSAGDAGEAEAAERGRN